MDSVSDLWDALREGDTGEPLFWGAVGVLVLIAAILLCTVRCCIWCRQRRKQREFNKERNDSLDPAALWDVEGRTCPVKESYPPDSQGAEVQMPLKAKHFRVCPHPPPQECSIFKSLLTVFLRKWLRTVQSLLKHAIACFLLMLTSRTRLWPCLWTDARKASSTHSPCACVDAVSPL